MMRQRIERPTQPIESISVGFILAIDAPLKKIPRRAAETQRFFGERSPRRLARVRLVRARRPDHRGRLADCIRPWLDHDRLSFRGRAPPDAAPGRRKSPRTHTHPRWPRDVPVSPPIAPCPGETPGPLGRGAGWKRYFFLPLLCAGAVEGRASARQPPWMRERSGALAEEVGVLHDRRFHPPVVPPQGGTREKRMRLPDPQRGTAI